MVSTTKHGDNIVGGEDVKISTRARVGRARSCWHQIMKVVHRDMGYSPALSCADVVGVLAVDQENFAG